MISLIDKGARATESLVNFASHCGLGLRHFVRGILLPESPMSNVQCPMSESQTLDVRRWTLDLSPGVIPISVRQLLVIPVRRDQALERVREHPEVMPVAELIEFAC